MIKKSTSRSLKCVSLALMGVIMFGNVITVHAGTNIDSSNKHYYKKTSDKTTYLNNGTLTSYLERKKQPTKSGNTGAVDYYVYAKYEGSKTVSKIMSTWTCSGTFLTSDSSSVGLEVGTSSASASTSVSSGYTTIDVKSYLYNDNGTELAWYSSNYVLSPWDTYKSTSMKNEAYVLLKGETIPTKINASA